MITIAVDPSDPRRLIVAQEARRPRVYLDMAPLMDVAASPEMRERFVRALLRADGTLLLSFMHLIEFMKVTSAKTSAEAEELLVAIDRHYAFMEVIPEAVAWKMLRGVPVPELDGSILRVYVGESRSLDPFDPRGFLQFLGQSPRADKARKDFGEMAGRTALLVEKVRIDSLSDKAVKLRLDRIPDAKSGKPPIAEAYADLIRMFIKDARRPFTSQDVADLFHTAAALTYADYLVLDKGWADLAESTAHRLSRVGITAPTARIYRAGNINAFVNDFDA